MKEKTGLKRKKPIFFIFYPILERNEVTKYMAKAPEHLTQETQKWYRQILKDYELESHHLKLLTAAAECWDRILEAREQISKDGAYLDDRFGQKKPHPALKIEVDNKILFARLIRELCLDIEPPKDPGRPPALY